jgi:hypothetical protein
MYSAKVVAVIVTWNKQAEVLRCINSVLASAHPVEAIVVVDNASTDGTAEAIKQQFGVKVHLLTNASNKGGSGGFHDGISAALGYQADYLWLLDNDVIVAPEALSQLLDVAQQQPQAGIVGSKVYFAQAPEIIWSMGARVNHWLADISVVGDKVRDTGQYNQLIEVEYVPMCSMLVRTKVIQTVGSVDPDYFVYSDDVDFCTRAKRAGFGVLSVPQSIVWHDVTMHTQRMSPFAMYYYTRNCIHYFLKFAPAWYKPVTALLSLLFLGRRLLATVKYWPGWAAFVQVERAALIGFYDAWRGKRGKVY